MKGGIAHTTAEEIAKDVIVNIVASGIESTYGSSARDRIRTPQA
jgi:hypothetical protein